MSDFKDKNIGTNTYKLPLAGASAPWGEELSDLLDALIDQVGIVSGPNDISETSFTIANTSGVKLVTGLAFNSSQVRSAEISFNLTRKTTKTISAIPTGTGVIQIDCATDHGLFAGDSITIAGSNSTPSIDGTYTVVAKVDADSFTINIGATNVTVAGTAGTFDVELVESGIFLINYGQQGWSISEETIGQDSLVVFDVNSSGQFTYDPTVLTGASYTGTMKFIAKALITT